MPHEPNKRQAQGDSIWPVGHSLETPDLATQVNGVKQTHSRTTMPITEGVFLQSLVPHTQSGT